LNSHRKNALTSLEMVTTSSPVRASRNSWSTAYRSCIGNSGRNRITIVSGPIDSERVNTSYPSTARCRCISRSPDASYAACSWAWSSTLDTPTQAPPSYGFMYSGYPSRSATASRSNGRLYRAAVYAHRALSTGCLYGTSTVSGTFSPSRIIAQYAACFSIDWNVNGLLSRYTPSIRATFLSHSRGW
jgi:hypothetical protein